MIANYMGNGTFESLTSVCTTKDTCPCGKNAKRCTDHLGTKYCVGKTESCPVLCTSDQRTCYVPNYSGTGELQQSEMKCVPKDVEACPCGTNTQKCTQGENKFCQFS